MIPVYLRNLPFTVFINAKVVFSASNNRILINEFSPSYPSTVVPGANEVKVSETSNQADNLAGLEA